MTKLSDAAKNFFHRSSHKTETSKNQASTLSAGECDRRGYLLADAIHQEFNKRRPHGNPHSAIKRLKNLIHTKLNPTGRISAHTHATEFQEIEKNDHGLFILATPNGQHLTRTQEEITRHILLQSQFRQCSPEGHDTGDTVVVDRSRPANKRARSQATVDMSTMPSVPLEQPSLSRPSPRPSSPPPHEATPVSRPTSPLTSPPAETPPSAQTNTAADFRPPEEMQNASGSKSRIYFSQTIDMEEVDMLLSQSHKCKTISSLNNNCWWRTSFAASIMQHHSTPARLTAAFEKLELGTDYVHDIQNVVEMAAGNARNGMKEIFTEITQAEINHDLDQPSRLKMPGEQAQKDSAGNTMETAGEASCRRLTQAILLKKGHDANEVEQCVNGNAPGELHLVTTLVEALDADLIIFNQPWTRNEMPPRWNVEESTLTICSRPDSFLSKLEHEPNKAACTAAVLRETDVVPILGIRATHYNLHITGTNTAKCNYPIL